MAINTRAIFVATLVITSFLAACDGEILFSTLKKALDVSVKHKGGGMCCVTHPFLFLFFVGNRICCSMTKKGLAR